MSALSKALAMPGVNSFYGGNRYEDYDILSFPGGNSLILRYFIKKMIPKAFGNATTLQEVMYNPIDFESLDDTSQKVRMMTLKSDGISPAGIHWMMIPSGVRRSRAN